jgi:peptidoglycan/xylan/chitin deacetylase (PgdA/CDA1 family)
MRPEVALSFDDGPDPVATCRVVDSLARFGVHGTFFWLGGALDQAPDAVRCVAQAGHQIGLHGDVHRPFWGRSDRSLRPALEQLCARIADLTGRPPESLRDLRPPYGLVTPGQATRIATWGFRLVVCDVLPGDWAAPTSIVVARVLRRVRSGSIIALHDGGPGRKRIVEHIKALVPVLLERGLRPVTIAELAPSSAVVDASRNNR